MQVSRSRSLTISAGIAGGLLVLALAMPGAAQDNPFDVRGGAGAGANVFAPPPIAGGRTTAPAGAYGRVPTTQELSGVPGWGQDVAPGLNQRIYTNASYPNASALDPNVVAPEQSIKDFVETPAAAQPTVESPGLLPWGPLKSVRSQTTWVGGNDLGFVDFELWSKIAFPTISEYSVLTLTPGYGLHLVNGPQTPDLPAQLHDLYLDVQWLNPFSREWAVELGLTPGLYGDFESSSEHPFRIGARIVGYYTMSPVWRFAAGVAYLDRDDIEWFPLGGIIWTPDDEHRLELVLPRPKYSQRFCVCGGCEDWWFVGGEFGGGSWAVERADGTADHANYSDWRLSLGWERRSKAGPTMLAELGYVFHRRLTYNSGGPDFDPDSTFEIRAMMGF